MSVEKWKETIVALATPPGIGAIAVIRLSGEQAISIADNLFPSKNIVDVPANTAHVGILKDNSIVLDEVVLTVFRAPKSYTGQDAIEISCHGSPYIQKQIIEACIRHGARLAEPGEFTMRAFLNGKMDLVQAEAVADLIASETKAAQETALNHLKGGFSHVLASLREELISFSALIELELDFSQEDVEFADRSKLKNLLSIIDRTVVELIQSFQLGNVIKNGVSVAIVGKPNAGKSTLLNALLNENRAIVSEIPGTTRDTIEEVLNIKGILFRLIDTAGLRSSTDQIESIGVERSKEKMKAADLVVVLFDVHDTTASEINELIAPIQDLNKPIVYVGNKAEKISEIQKQQFSAFDPIFVSAKEKLNLDELKNKLYHEVVTGKTTSENTIVTNTRHLQSLQKVKQSLDAIAKGMQENIPGDLIAIDIRECLYHLGVITGTISNEDQLDFIFSKFCIGK